jgi:hypothetical protein
MLRGSIICVDLAEMGGVWTALQALETQGVLSIKQTKNRFRGNPLPGGYRDVNINVLYEGMVCEVQLHAESHYSLKKECHPVYALCRTYGLVGDLDDDDDEAPNELLTDYFSAVIYAVRFLFASMLTFMGWFYGYYAFETDPFIVYSGFSGLTKTWKALSLCIPCWVIGGLFYNHMTSWTQRAICLASGLAFVVYDFTVLGNASVVSFVCFAMAFVYFVYTKVRKAVTDDESSHVSRMALLYATYLGVDGIYFAWKVALLQLMTVTMQSYTKLLVLGTGVSTTAWASVGMYWIFLSALIVNAALSPILLCSENPWMRREGVMILDVAMDCLYIVGFAAFQYAHQGNVAAVFNADIISFSSNALPTLRILAIARTLEKGPKNPEHEPARLPRNVAIGFGACSLAILIIIFGYHQEVYPWNGENCRPCICNEEGTLERCDFDDAETRLFLGRRGIYDILPGVFDGMDALESINLNSNSIATLETGTFVELSDLKLLVLGYNNIELINATAFENLPNLEILILRQNAIPTSMLEGLRSVFEQMPQMNLLYLTGNDLACDDVEPYFQGTCRDAY